MELRCIVGNVGIKKDECVEQRDDFQLHHETNSVIGA